MTKSTSDIHTTRHKAIRIAIFNHKGGVGKTTLTVNIAAALVEQDFNVLLVDTDPQCNLSSYFLEDRVLDELLDKSDQPSGRTIWSALKPIIETEGDFKKITPYENKFTGLLFIPGDIRLSEYEDILNDAWTDCLKRRLRGFKTTTAISRLVNDIAIENKLDFVFYDSGPNIGALNRTILLDCDYFIIPLACDLFSIRALKTLGHTLTSWINEISTINNLSPQSYYLLPGNPVFLGYIPQRFRIYRGVPTSTNREFIPKMEKNVNSEIVTPLRRIHKNLSPFSSNEIKLGQIKDYPRLAIDGQKMGVPLWRVGSSDLKQEQFAYSEFHKLANKISSQVYEK